MCVSLKLLLEQHINDGNLDAYLTENSPSVKATNF